MFKTLRILSLLLLLFLGIQCASRPYRPNYNEHTSHNDIVKSRNRIVQNHADDEIRRSNLQRKRGRKDRQAKKTQRKAAKYSKKLIK